jgi:ribosomal-protein-alanine N-acetyltransferase
MNYKLTPMTIEHIPQIAALERACFSRPWSEESLQGELWNDSAVVIVAEGEDGTVLGYAGLQTVLDEGYINNVAVDEKFRRQGVADELIAAFVRFGQAKLAFLTLEVRASNAPAIGLYAKHGFVEVGRRKNYYDDPKEDALLMTLFFADGTEAAE